MLKFGSLLKSINSIKGYGPLFTSIRSYNNMTKTLSTHITHQQTGIISFPKFRLFSVEEKLEVKHPNLLAKILSKLPFTNLDRTRLSVTGYILYESIVDKINYSDFFEEFSLPDTFYSWFVVTELHVWMLMVRCMEEGESGRFVRNKMVEALWSDVGLRIKKVGAANPYGTRAHVAELSEQFQAALLAYDEGLQSDDIVLAGALWRRMYQQKEADPEYLDLLIQYIRKHVKILDTISKKELFSQKYISWKSPVHK